MSTETTSGLSPRTANLVKRRWRAFCQAVLRAEEEHGAPLELYFGESQVVADRACLEDHHEGRLSVLGDRDYKDGGSVLIDLPEVHGVRQDGGGW